jgi:hypothetical protein
MLDRREFVAAAAAVGAVGALPLPLPLPLRAAVAGAGASVGAGTQDRDAAGLDDWSIDDMWTGYPRPAAPIAYGRGAPQRFATTVPREPERRDPQLLA